MKKKSSKWLQLVVLWVVPLVCFMVFVSGCGKQSPYNGITAAIPGAIEAENYDVGSDGVSYHDSGAGNSKQHYRTDGVDIDKSSDGRFFITDIDVSEWLEYTVKAEDGNYYIYILVSSVIGGGSFHIEMDGNDITGRISFARTGGTNTWATLKIGPLRIRGGKHVMKIVSHGKGFNIDSLTFLLTDHAPCSELPAGVSADLPVLSTVPWLHVDGKWIMDGHKNRVVLRGVAVADLEVIFNDKMNPSKFKRNKSIFEIIDLMTDHGKGWYPSVVRFTIHPEKFIDETGKHPGWNGSDKEDYFRRIIDPAVMYAAKKGLYVIIDWHYIYVDCTREDIQKKTQAFWEFIAPRYAHLSNVIFEVLNEPGQPASWYEYLPIVQKWVNTIRKHAPDNLILVGGPDWAKVLPMPRPSKPTELIKPVQGKNIVYVCHIYPGSQPQQNAGTWESVFGGTANVAPVILTEWGFEYGAPQPTSGTVSSWGAAFKKYIDSKENISWTAWCFDPIWHPVMFDRKWKLLGGNNYMGEFTRQWLLEKKDRFRPARLKKSTVDK